MKKKKEKRKDDWDDGCQTDDTLPIESDPEGPSKLKRTCCNSLESDPEGPPKLKRAYCSPSER